MNIQSQLEIAHNFLKNVNDKSYYFLKENREGWCLVFHTHYKNPKISIFYRPDGSQEKEKGLSFDLEPVNGLVLLENDGIEESEVVELTALVRSFLDGSAEI